MAILWKAYGLIYPEFPTACCYFATCDCAAVWFAFTAKTATVP